MKIHHYLLSLALGVGLLLPAIPVAQAQSVSTDRLTGVEAGIAIKAPVRVATTGNISLSGIQTINSVTLMANDRVLVKNQTNQKQNGIYTVKTGDWVRASDFDGNRDAVNGTLVYVTDGLTNASKFFKLVTSSTIVFGTSNIVFAQVSTGSGGGGVSVNVDDFIDPASSDATTGIQAAIDAAGQRGIVQFGCAKTYFLSATLRPSYGQKLRGCGINSTILTRSGSYGHTIEFGSDSVASGPVEVSGMWLRHGTAHVTNDVSLDNRLTDGSAHIYIHSAQGAVISDVWAWRMPYQVVLDGGSITTLQNNQFVGIWDHTSTALQEGLAQVYLKATGTGGNPTIINISKNKFMGASSPLRTVSYVATDRTQAKSVVEVIGSKCGILVEGNESGVYSENYFGGMNESNICFNGVTNPGAATLGLQIVGNYFDTARNYAIDFNPASGTNATDIAVTGNTFNGQFDGFGAIQARSVAGIPSVNILNVVGNSMFAHVGGPVKLFGARNAVVSGNTIANYNALDVSLVDPSYTAAIQAGGSSSNTNITGNTVCGLNAYSYDGIVIAGGLTRVYQQNNTNGGCTRFANQQAPTPVDFLGSTSGKVTVKAAATTSDWTMTLPSNDGNLGDVVVSDGSGGLSFSPPGGIAADLSSSTVTATAGTVARTLADHLSNSYDVRNYGAKCDGRELTDVTATSGSPDITSASYSFTADDVGSYVDITSLQSGIVVATSQIISVSVSAGTATMADNALFSGANRRLVMYKTDDTTAINNAITAVSAKGGRLKFPSGYCAASAITLKRLVILKGEGRHSTVLYQIRGSNTTLVKSENFDALTGTGLNYGPNGTFNGILSDSRVPSWFGLEDIAIDGNRSRQTSGSCAKWYGNAQISYRALYMHCFEYGRWTEASGGYAYIQYDWKASEEGYFYDDFMRDIGKDAWVMRGPHDSSVSKFLAYDWGHSGTGYYAIRNESVGALYNGSSHWDDIHAYTSAGGDFKNFYLGAGGDFRFIYTDFGSTNIPSSNTKINTIYALQCGVGGSSPCINITGDFNSIDQIGFSWFSNGTLPSNLIGINIAYGADGNTIKRITGSSTVSSTANNTFFKNRGAFNKVGGVLSNMNGANNVCADIGGSYGNFDFTGFSCATFVKLDNVVDSDNVEFNNRFNLSNYRAGAQVSISGTFAGGDVVNFIDADRSFIKTSAGSAALPSIKFTNLETGFYGSATTVATSISGVQTGLFDANGFKSVAGTLEAGNAGTIAGKVKLNGNTSGTITIQTQAAAGSYNLNLPTTAGASGSPLLSGGGGSSAMTYGSRSGNTTVFGTTSGTLTSGNCAEFDASGNIVDSGAACGGGGGGGTVGPLVTDIATVTANTTLTTSSQTVLCDATSGTVTLTLPSAASAYSAGNGNIFTIKKIDASLNHCIISVTGGATNIDGTTTHTITDQWDDLSVQSNGTQYYRLRH